VEEKTAGIMPEAGTRTPPLRQRQTLRWAKGVVAHKEIKTTKKPGAFALGSHLQGLCGLFDQESVEAFT